MHFTDGGDYVKIGQYLKEYREATKISQRELAKRCNVSNSFISMLEKDNNPHTNKPIDLSVDKYQAIAAGTGITLYQLFVILGEDTPDKFKPLLPEPMRKELNIAIDPVQQLKSDNIHFIVKGMNRLTPEQVERVSAVVYAMYPEVFKDEKGDE